MKEQNPSAEVSNGGSKVEVTIRWLAIGRCLTRMGDQMWSFALPITMVILYADTIAPGSFLTLFALITKALFMPRIGAIIDKERRKRKQVIRFGIFVQTLSVVLSSILIILLIAGDERDSVFLASTTCRVVFPLLVASHSLGFLAAGAMDIVITKDWIPALDLPLTRVNSLMSRIDLITEVVAPLVCGFFFLFHFYAGFALSAAWNIVSFLPEYGILIYVYNLNSGLLQVAEDDRETELKSMAEVPPETPGDIEEKPNEIEVTPPAESISEPSTQSEKEKGPSKLRVFWSQSVSVASLAYTLLWFSVLSPHGVLLTSYLKTRDVPEVALGAFRAAGAFGGVMGTFAFPRLKERLGLLGACNAFIAGLGVCVAAAAGVLVGSPASSEGVSLRMGIFLVAVVVSRPGLYGFIIGEVELLQANVFKSTIGVFNSVESSLCAYATLLTLAVAVVVSNPGHFKWLVLGSASCVVMGSVVFISWSRRAKGVVLEAKKASDSSISADADAATGEISTEETITEDDLSEAGTVDV